MDILFHLLIPLMILFIIENKIYLSTILLSFFSIFPDFDVFISKSLHRILFQNIFVVLIPILLGIYLRYKKKNKKARIFFIIAFFVFSHIILDLTYGGTALFYPLSKKFVEVKFEITTYSNLIPRVEYYVKLYEPMKKVDWRVSQTSEIKPGIIVWRNSFMILLLLLISIPFSHKKFENDIMILKKLSNFLRQKY